VRQSGDARSLARQRIRGEDGGGSIPVGERGRSGPTGGQDAREATQPTSAERRAASAEDRRRRALLGGELSRRGTGRRGRDRGFGLADRIRGSSGAIFRPRSVEDPSEDGAARGSGASDAMTKGPCADSSAPRPRAPEIRGP
jgi:hypothetical protein